MIQPTQESTDGARAFFLAFGAVTGVGSLPHAAATGAVEFIGRRAPEVPFWPQLRRRSPRESMIPQTFGPAIRHLTLVPGEHAYAIASADVERFAASLERDAGRIEVTNAAGLAAFLAAFDAGDFPDARAVKGQCMGPVTLACSLLVDGQPFIEVAELRELLANHVVRLARWQIDELQTRSRVVLLVLDEAYLGVTLRREPERFEAMTQLLRSVVLRLRRPGVLIGIHCCDEIPPETLTAVGPDIYSFDAFHGGEILAADPHTHRFLADGGRLAWGWIPTLDDLSGVDAESIAARWWAACQPLIVRGGGVTARRILETSLVTAACGLAGSSEATCDRSFELAHEVASRFASYCKSG